MTYTELVNKLEKEGYGIGISIYRKVMDIIYSPDKKHYIIHTAVYGVN